MARNAAGFRLRRAFDLASSGRSGCSFGHMSGVDYLPMEGYEMTPRHVMIMTSLAVLL